MQKDTLLKAPVLATLLFCAAAPAARGGTVLTLSEAVARSVSHSYELKSRDADISRAEAGARQAGAMRLPVLQLRSEMTRGDDPVYVFGSLLRQKKFGMSDFSIDRLNKPDSKVNFANSLELGMPLFTGFKLRDYRRLAGIAVEQGRKVRGFAEKGTAFETTQKYLLLSLKTELARIAGETISSTKDEIAAADRLKEKGFVLGSDYYAAQAVLSSLSAAKTGFAGEAQGVAAAINV
ncbi:MAG: TolC family protein, partial [Elusimicrobiota bacterium]|nr:TolC family protein [Elusimicrobiota bacterium]